VAKVGRGRGKRYNDRAARVEEWRKGTGEGMERTEN
jgi:hypothetical protein